jgi:Siphovirus Gp157
MPDLLYEVQLLELEIEKLIAEFPDLKDDEQLRADMLEGSTSALDVLSRVVSAALDAKSMAAAISNRIDELASRSARHERREAAMRRLAYRLMVAGDLKKAVLPEATLGRTKGRDSVEITDQAALPRWALKIVTTETPSKTVIKEAIEAGIPVAGAKIVTGEETLTMKVS